MGIAVQQRTSTRAGRRSARALVTTFWIAVFTAVVIWGWMRRDMRLLDASEGLGYALGIIGGTMMALMLLYTMRKRFRAFSKLLRFQWWFSMHMWLGIVGPICILYHCNFSLGSPNSTVAFFAMHLMVTSGLVGRYLYSRIHHGLYGRRVTLADLRGDLQRSHKTLKAMGHEELPSEFTQLEAYATKPVRSLIGSLWRWQRVRRKSTRARRQLRQIGTDRGLARQYAAQLRSVARFSFFERMFSLWHVLHIPIFILLVVSALF
ncbi:MAG: hypothetical protein P8Y95_01360, partial [Gammaproteobacteria bacterium]